MAKIRVERQALQPATVPRSLDRVLFWALMLLAAILGGLFVWKWDVGFSSDQALIGLMGLKHLQGGPEEIYVWRVGYQGILLEVHLIKWIFQFLGQGSSSTGQNVGQNVGMILTLGPYLCFLGMIAAFHSAVSRSFSWDRLRSQSIAHWSTLFLIVSTPFLYERVIRTQPNYVETYLFGLCLFILYFEIRRTDSTNNLPSEVKSRLWQWALFGFLSGFAIYTYEQIYYFLAALGAHAAWTRWRTALIEGQAGKVQNGPHGVRPTLTAHRNLLVKQTLKTLYLGLTALGVYYFFTLHKGSLIEVSILGKKIKTSSASLFEIAAVGALFTFHQAPLIRFLKNLVQEVRAHIVPILVATASVVVGLSPKLYYRYVLKGFVPYDHHALRGEWASMRVNFEALKEALTQFLILDFQGNFGHSLFVAWCLLIAVAIWLKQITLSRQRDHFDWLFFFAAPMTVIFMISGSVADLDHSRYYLPILFPVSILLGFATQFVWEFCAQRNLRAYLLIPAYVLGQIHFHSFEKELRISNHALSFNTLIAELDRRGIDRAYGNYWFGYSTTFLTLERIQVEPCFSNYAPDYEREVASSQKIALIDFKNAVGQPDTCGLQIIDGTRTLDIRGHVYTIESEFDVDFKGTTIRQDRFAEERIQKEPVHVWVLNKKLPF